MQTSEVLNKAADLIEERGWIKGQGWQISDPDPGSDTTGAVCLEGALQLAMGIPAMTQVDAGLLASRLMLCPAGRALSEYLDHGGYLFTWNDRGNRTAAEVIETLRAAAVIEQAREAATEHAETRRTVPA